MTFAYVRLTQIVTMSLLALATMKSFAEINSVLQYHTATRMQSNACETSDCEIPFSEIRAQFKGEHTTDDNAHSFIANIELLQDFVFDESTAQVRELYWNWSKDAVEFRAGRQMITWGTGDMLFINDIFAKDWNAYFGGMPVDYLKRPTDAIKIDFYPGTTTIETVVSRFDEDHLPEQRRLEIPVQKLSLPITGEKPNDDLNNVEIAAKISRSISDWDLSAYAAKSYWRMPTYTPQSQGTYKSYSRLNTYGASLTGQINNGVFNLEAGYYDSREDLSGKNPFINNSQVRLLTGYSHQLWTDSTIGLQLYVEHLKNYNDYLRSLAPTMSPTEELNKVATLRFTQLLMHQTVTINVFSYWGLSASDRFLQSSLRYAFNDHFWGELGMDIFSGNPKGTFGVFDRNDNVYLTLRLAY